MDEVSVVSRASFQMVLPILAPEPMALLPERVWTDEQWQRIQRGYKARDMDDKWNAFVEGQVMFAHRSWTGHGIYEATFSAVDGGWQISSAVVESDPDRMRRSDAESNRIILQVVIDSIVLGESSAGLIAEMARLSRAAHRP